MKKIITVLAFCMVMVFTVSNDVVHAQSAPTFQCRASSYNAVGMGWGPTRDYAARRALHECAVRTPYGDVCYIDWCRRVN